MSTRYLVRRTYGDVVTLRYFNDRQSAYTFHDKYNRAMDSSELFGLDMDVAKWIPLTETHYSHLSATA